MHTHILTYMHTYRHAYVYIYIHMCIFTGNEHAYLQKYIHTFIHTSMHDCIHKCPQIHRHTYIAGVSILHFCIEFQYFGKKTLHCSIMLMSLHYITNDVISLSQDYK